MLALISESKAWISVPLDKQRYGLASQTALANLGCSGYDSEDTRPVGN